MISVFRYVVSFGSGVWAYEHYDTLCSLVKKTVPPQSVPKNNDVVLRVLQPDMTTHSIVKYTGTLGLGTLALGWLWNTFTFNRVTTQQFKHAYTALQSQIGGVSKALVRVKDKVCEAFGVVEKRLDDVEQVVRTSSCEVRRDIANVDLAIAGLTNKVDTIESQTRYSSKGIHMLCNVVQQHLDNAPYDKATAVTQLDGVRAALRV